MSEDNVQDSPAVEAGASAEDAEAARLKAEAEAQAREAAEEAQARADAEEARAAMAAAQAAALQAEAEAENAERDALAASLAAMLAANAAAVPEPVVPLDRVEAPRGSFGPTFWDELSEAGASALAFIASADHVIFSSDISADDRAKVMAVIEAHVPVAAQPDMPALRQAAFDTAMAYGNGITAKITGTYSDVEARTWPLQRAQADTVLHGGELPEDALLRKLATRRGMELEAFALLVQHKAEAFETIADVGQMLRLGAEGLLSEAIDTPKKLDDAFEDLRAQTLAAAADLGLTI